MRGWPAGQPVPPIRALIFAEDGTPTADTIRHCAAVASTGEAMTVNVRVVLSHPKIRKDAMTFSAEEMGPTPIAPEVLDKRTSSPITTSHNDIPEWQKAGRGYAGHGIKW